MDILYVFLPLIVLLGIVTSYEDIIIGKIRNKWISIAVFIAVLLWFMLYFLNVVSLNYVFLVFVHGLSALIIGFFVWFVGLWGAGDAKLYFAFSLLIPLLNYQQGDFPAMVLFVNAFLPIFIFLVGKLLIKSSGKQKLNILRNVLQPKNLGSYLLIVFALSWASDYLFLILGIGPNYVLSILAILGLYKLVEKVSSSSFFKQKNITSKKILGGICVLRIFLEYQLLMTPAFWIGFFILTLAYGIIRMFMSGLGELFSKDIVINNLQEGMVLAEMITKKGGKKKVSIFGYSQLRKNDSLFDMDSSGLGVKDIKKIKEMYKKGKIKFKSIKVQETLSFAPFIFLGVLLTLYVKGSLIFFVINLFS